MHTLASAAALLARAGSIDELSALAAAVGCGEPHGPLDGEARRALAIPDSFVRASVATGSGALRALLVETRAAISLREDLGRLAAKLAARTPHLMWIVLAADPSGSAVAVATWTADRAVPRIAALIADRTRILDSDAETVRSLASARGIDDILTHARWTEVLGREALTRRFFLTLERSVRGLADGLTESVPAAGHRHRMELALLTVSRLLFLAFLEAKGWLDGDRDFLSRTFAQQMSAGGGYHRRFLVPLLFGTLNTPVRHRAPRARALGRIPFLNGGLFTRSPWERRYPRALHSDERLGAVFSDLLARHRFTAREGVVTWSETAIDPEMLGRAFETLMASDVRRRSGAFYTPHEIVQEVTSQALRHAFSHAGLAGAAAEVEVDTVPRMSAAEQKRMAPVLRALRVLDPACGSGAFLVHALDRLTRLRVAAGDPRPPSDLRRDVLASSIFGVDINPTAVWLCELRLWLAVVIDSEETDPLRAVPLPNLDHNVRVGDSLSGEGFGEAPRSGSGSALAALRVRYVRATGSRKRTLASRLDRAERRAERARLDRAIAQAGELRGDLLSAVRARDLFGERHSPDGVTLSTLRSLRERVREARATLRRLDSGGPLPFCWDAHFADVASAGGFDVVVGNPPWVRLNSMPRSVRVQLRRRFEVFGRMRSRTLQGRTGGSTFAEQVDLSAVFVERSLSLLRPGGIVALLVPAKLWRTIAGRGVRRLLTEHAELRLLEDWCHAPAAFEASVYPSLMVARRRAVERPDPPHARPTLEACVRIRETSLRWTLPPSALALDDLPGSPWLLLPPAVRDAFDRLRAAGRPLVESALGRPRQGVKCGANDAFLVRLRHIEGKDGAVRAAGREGLVELSMLRPVLRGEGVRPWERAPSTEMIVWTHDAGGAVLARLPPLAARWLGPARPRLEARADARPGHRWWELFRVDGASCDRWRVVWPDVGRGPRALVLEPGDPVVPLNSCYVVSSNSRIDALALATLLNSPLASAFLQIVGEPARGSYFRSLAWSVGMLPIPHDWARVRGRLAAIARRATAGAVPGAQDLIEAALRAYGLSRESIAPLLEWCAR